MYLLVVVKIVQQKDRIKQRQVRVKLFSLAALFEEITKSVVLVSLLQKFISPNVLSLYKQVWWLKLISLTCFLPNFRLTSVLGIHGRKLSDRLHR